MLDRDPLGTKIELVFDLLETDRDGYVELADYQSLIDRHVTACGRAGNDHTVSALGDHQISKKEFSCYVNDVWWLTAPDPLAMFEALDNNVDGFISRSEFVSRSENFSSYPI